MKTIWKRLALFAVILLPGAQWCDGQAPTAQVVGKITDATNAVVPAAAVTVTNEETGVRFDTVSTDVGNFAVPLLPPGTYRITVQKEGFRPLSRTGIVLQIDQVARIDFVLDVGAITEQVEVRGATPLLAQESSSLGQVVDNAKIVNVPLNGRSPLRLVLLMPGVVGVPAVNGQFGDIAVNTQNDSDYSINGGQTHSSEVLIDGVPSTVGPTNVITTIPTVESAQEFKVESNNLSAEFGRFSGGVVSVSTRSGTNSLHGTVFEFLRNNVTDANEFFNNAASMKKIPFRMNQFGAAVGGPVALGRLYNGRNRTFFFADYQATRWRRGGTYNATVPTEQERAGDFTQTFNGAGQLIVVYDPVTTRPDPARPGQYIRDSFPGNKLPVARLDPVARRIIEYYPLPRLPGHPLTHANNFMSNAVRTVDKDEFSARLDHNVTSNYRLFGRVSRNLTNLQQPNYFGNVATGGDGNAGKAVFHYTTAVMDHTLVLSPTSFLDVRVGFARMFQDRPTRSYGFDQTVLGMPSSLVRQFQIPLFPAITVEGYAGMAGNSYQLRGYNTASLLPSWTRIVGSHNLKSGADVRLRRLNQTTVDAGGGAYTFNRTFTRGPNPNVFTANSGVGVATMLLGAPTSGSAGIVPGLSQQNWYVAGYVQDSIRWTNRLTVNFGLRYEIETAYTERRNALSWLDPTLASPVRNASFPNLTGGLRFAGADGDPRTVYASDHNNFAPRAGLAYTVSKSTVFRGGVGMFYAGLETSSSNTGTYPTAGFSATTTMISSLDGLTPYRYVSNPFPDGISQPTRNTLGGATALGQNVRVWDVSPRTPYAVQWNADLQQRLRGDFVFDLAYSANRGIKLARGRDQNALNPQYLPLGTGLQKLVPNPFAGRIPSGPLSQPQVATRQLLLPYPQFAGLSVIDSTSGNSIYHSMQLKLEKRMRHGSGFLFSYSASKMISDCQNAVASFTGEQSVGVQNWYDLRSERSVSQTDVSQALVLSYVLEVPVGPNRRFLSGARGVPAKLLQGWGIAGVASRRTGFPLAITAPNSGAGSTTRPNSTGRSANLSTSRPQSEKLRKWFDTQAFTVPQPFTFGNVSTILPDVRGPGLANLDLSLIKDTKLFENTSLQFRAEAFNLTNTPPFGLPNAVLGDLTFGQINSTALMPRVIQFSLKLLF